MREFAILFIWKGIQESRRNRTIEDEIALEQLDSFKCLESSRLSWGRLTTSNIWTFIVYGIGIRAVWVIFNVGVLKIRRPMVIIIHTKLV